MDQHLSIFRMRLWMLRGLPCPRWLSLPRAQTPSEVPLGGPIFKNHTFFFGDYEGMRFRTQTVRQETVPNQAMRDGDFSGFLGGQSMTCGDTVISPALMRWDGRSSPVRFMIRSPPDRFRVELSVTALVLIRSPVYLFRGRPTLSPRVALIPEPPRSSSSIRCRFRGAPQFCQLQPHPERSQPYPLRSVRYSHRPHH